METTGSDVGQHPLLAAVHGAHARLLEHVETPTWSLDVEATTELVRASAALAATVAEVEARAIGHAETLDVAGAAGMRGTAQWVARTTTLTQGAAHAKVRLARAVAGHEQTRVALARGEVHAEQALVVTGSLDLLDHPEHLDAEQAPVSRDERERAEKHLLGEATDHDAHALGRLGGRLFEVLDPAGADAHEARALAAQEQRARARTRFTMREVGEGLCRGSFTIPTAQASMLTKALLALAAPKATRAREGAGSYDHRVPTPTRLGHAFLAYLERYPVSRLPKVGGLSASVVAIGDFSILLGDLTAARLDTGVRISHLEYLRLACEAGVIPAWMDTTGGTALSLGRNHRFHRPHQRLAKLLETDTCEHPGCQSPAYLGHLHHTISWATGGTTDTATAVILCPFHHHQAHATGTTYPLRT